MPVFDDTMDQHTLAGSNYGFSAKRIEELGATEYTLVAIACDVSGSVSRFSTELEACLQEIVRACASSPRADNLMLRLVVFNHRASEFHGFKPLAECHVDDYKGLVNPGGSTALFDTACNLTDSLVQYSSSLFDNDFDTNGILFVLTDGVDNASTLTADSLRQSLEKAIRSEALESLVSVLIGVNEGDAQLAQHLQNVAQTAGFTQHVAIDRANAQALSRLAYFVSRSVSAQSQSLGTGGPSASLTF